MQLIRSSSLDPFHNIALEDALLEEGADTPRLVLWQSAHAVVIGRNQNPWLECNLPALQASGGFLVRRVSGGGAVYHDAGNLNYALILPRDRYREGTVADAFCAALVELGVRAQPLGKSSVAVEGRKVSGTAFCYRRRHVLHHGTLLVRADLDRLRDLLRPVDLGIEGRAIPSEPAPVANLADFADGVTIDRARDALIHAFASRFGPLTGEMPADRLVPADPDRFRNAAWRFDRTPRFTARCHLEQGPVTLDIHRGIVESATPGDLAGEPFRPQAWGERYADSAWRAWIDGFGEVS